MQPWDLPGWVFATITVLGSGAGGNSHDVLIHVAMARARCFLLCQPPRLASGAVVVGNSIGADGS